MTDVLPMRHEGNGMFRCLHPNRIKLDVGEVRYLCIPHWSLVRVGGAE